MQLEDIVHIKIKSVGSFSHLAWAEGMKISLPYGLLKANRLSEHVDSKNNLVVPSDIPPFDINKIEDLRLAVAFTENKPLSSQLPFSYQIIPARLRAFLASLIGQWRRRTRHQWSVFPRWPLDLSVDFLSDLTTGKSSSFAKEPTPVVLTHDIDSTEGLQNLVKLFLGIEESVGALSTNFVVPCAWPIDHGLLQEIKDRGHEIGTHGYDHSNLTAFSSQEEQLIRLKAAQPLIDRYNIIGYRAPSLLRTHQLLLNLRKFYIYDSSIPTSGGPFPVPNNGCASARPFNFEHIVELPLSMPRDGSMLFLGLSPRKILKIWIDCAKKISSSGGVVLLLTHCESHLSGNKDMLDTYRNFLEFVTSSEQFEWSTPTEILEQNTSVET